MDIRISADGAPVLHEAEDFTSLRLTGTLPSDADVRAALGRSGIELTPDAGHGHLAPGTILRLAGARADEAEWRRQYGAMIEYATRKGWVDDSGRIRVHAEWDH